MYDILLQNFFGGLAVFTAGFTLGYVVKALGGISGVFADVAKLKADVTNIQLQSPVIIASTPTHTPSTTTVITPATVE